ncbi:uncharacterized protein LOC100378569 [Saccoglossus kowalevskii]|uniref:Uncharacterized protein LOC100378569 n=1 Tax=Saccoglossus kowalevskii TaxID=10224 RepID=A0ABM0M9F8_SACKO|nr:PREDICTED: uncharacterized protein LOC100378569 [Saccoglossus kowalevskii]
MQSLLLVAAVLTALIGFSHGQTEVASCPTSMMDFMTWMGSVIQYCNGEYLIALRESKENCEEKVGTLGPCLMTEKDKCIAGLDDGDMVKTTIEASLGALIIAAPGYQQVFCSGVTVDLNPTTSVGGCEDGMTAASQACHAPFMEIFNEDRVDLRLCEAYKTMAACETDKVKELCPNADSMEITIDEQTRAMYNFYCVETATPAPPAPATTKQMSKPATTAAAADNVDDDVDSGKSVVVSIVTIVSTTYLSIFTAL